DGLAIVSDRDGSGGVQRSKVGERYALTRPGRGGNGKHIDDRAAFGLTKPLDPLHRIDNWNCVGHGADRSEATSGRGGRARRNRLFVRLAGLAQVHMQIDEARRYRESTGIELLVRTTLDFVGRSNFGDPAILQQHVHGRVDARRRIDEVAALDQQTGAPQTASPQNCWFFPRSAHRIFPIARARIAMRRGTPLRTSSRMRAWAPSAISLVNSRPRMIGPGCITMASFFAILNRTGFIW